MKRLICRCGNAVYFENLSCGHCSRAIAFDPDSLSMFAEAEPGVGLPFCVKRNSASRCNWIAPGGGDCVSCRMSEIIPALSKPENHSRWQKLEQAKRRLLYDLLRLRLPVDASRLRFAFKEDRRTNPDVGEDHVAIGHHDGVITINAAEADEVYREQMRLQMNEPYRTLLGHFRHESGHYYFTVVVSDEDLLAFRRLFGDETANYDAALQAYYDNGPATGWQHEHISSYASAHPAEDWAECWAHYLHIRSVLETADATGIMTGVTADSWQKDFTELVISVNEIMRSMGLPDAYPFVITPPVAAKIELVHTLVSRFTGRPGGPSSAAG
jgi:hypothetical protein